MTVKQQFRLKAQFFSGRTFLKILHRSAINLLSDGQKMLKILKFELFDFHARPAAESPSKCHDFRWNVGPPSARHTTCAQHDAAMSRSTRKRVARMLVMSQNFSMAEFLFFSKFFLRLILWKIFALKLQFFIFILFLVKDFFY